MNNVFSASWSIDNAFVCGAGDLRFKSWAGQIEHNVANDDSSLLRHFFERSCIAIAQWHEDEPVNSLYASA